MDKILNLNQIHSKIEFDLNESSSEWIQELAQEFQNHLGGVEEANAGPKLQLRLKGVPHRPGPGISIDCNVSLTIAAECVKTSSQLRVELDFECFFVGIRAPNFAKQKSKKQKSENSQSESNFLFQEEVSGYFDGQEREIYYLNLRNQLNLAEVIREQVLLQLPDFPSNDEYPPHS